MVFLFQRQKQLFSSSTDLIPSIMQKNKTYLRFMNSFVALPFMLATLPFGPQSFMTLPATSIVNQDHIVEAVRQEDLVRKDRATKIDAYFAKIGSPLEGYGAKFIEEAEKNGIEWNMVAAIGMRESTGGIHSCKKVDNNFFGWGSCRIGFDSIDHAIEIVSKNLGGNNPNTAYHYDNKETYAILQAYNPPSIVKHYAEQVIGIMDDIANM